MVKVSALLKSFENAIDTGLGKSGLAMEVVNRDTLVSRLQDLENLQGLGKDGYVVKAV